MDKAKEYEKLSKAIRISTGKTATWDFYKNKKGASGFVTHKPHFKDYKDWLVMCAVIGNENTAQFFVCEGCLGIFVHEQPFRCGQCDNWSEFKFKEITCEMMAELMAGRTMANIIKSYSYT